MTLIAIGGAEDKTGDLAIWRRILAEAKGAESRIVILTTASSFPAERKKEYADVMARLGVSQSSIFHIETRPAAANETVLKEISAADIVFFTGGDQLKITSALSGTPLMEKITQRYADGVLVIAGSSAGAAAASSLMIYDGDPKDAMKRDAVSMTSGMNFLPNSVIDTHFTARDRLPRLFNALAMSPRVLGVGLDEDTGIVYKGGDTLEVIGSGTVTFVNGRSITDTTITSVGAGETFKVSGIKTEALPKGAVYSIKKRKPVTL